MNINSAESFHLNSSQTLQTCSVLCSSGLLGACFNDTELKPVARADEKLLPVPGSAAVHTLAAEFEEGVRKKHALPPTRL